MTLETLVFLTIAVPLVGGLLVSLSGSRPNLREAFTLVSSGVLLVVVALLTRGVISGARPEIHLLQLFPGLHIRFAVEPLGMLFAGIAALLWPVNSLYSIGYMRGNQEKNQTRFYVCFAVAIASAMGIAFSGNLVTLFAFYEALTLSTYPLVTHKGSEADMKAGRVYLGILLTTSVGLLLPAVVWTAHLAGTVDFESGGILAGRISGSPLVVLLVLYVLGIGKAAIMPVHRWLPAAMVAPTPVSALLHAVAVVKAGVFTVLKVVVYVFGLDLLSETAGADLLLLLSGFTVLAASIVALRILAARGNLKKLLAYSTVSQLSYVVLATAVLAPSAVAGAALHIVAHAFGKITLFFAAGSIYTATHRTEIHQLAGIGRRMPWTMAAFSVGALSMIGLPPAGGFVSKWYIVLGAFQAQNAAVLLIVTISTLLNAAYFIPIVYLAFFGREEEDGMNGADGGHGRQVHTPGGREAPLPVVLAVCCTAGLTLILFFFPDTALALARALAEVAS